MRTRLQPVLLALFLVFGVGVSGRAAQDPSPATQPRVVELVVFEHGDCTYCRIFRSAILPRYRENGQEARAPIRFVRVEHADMTALGLRGRITMVPTFVLMQDGREVGRIEGYWAPDNFFRLVASMLARTDP